MIDDNGLTSKAALLAREIHGGDRYGKYPYFDYHIVHVASNTIKVFNAFNLRTGCRTEIFNEYYIYVCVAYLHDLVEDHNVTIDYIADEFGSVIANAVDAITYRKGFETRNEYYDRCKANKYSRLVKFADASENMKNCIKENNPKREAYYKKVCEIMKIE